MRGAVEGETATTAATAAAASAAPRPARRRGPRGGASRGESSTRDAILDAARASFLARGFAATTIRGVARTAGVDPALVSYYFGSKGDLFGATMNMRIRSREIGRASCRERV